MNSALLKSVLSGIRFPAPDRAAASKAVGLFLLWPLCCAVSLAHADYVTVPARPVRYQPELHAWARVESVAPLVMRMPVAARVVRVAAVQGQHVAAGAPLVELSGPGLVARLADARARVKAARRELEAAREVAGSVTRNYPALTDRRTLATAQAALAAAQGRFETAEADEQALRGQTWLKSPLAAEIEAVHVAPGADLPDGAPLLTLLPDGRLWLRAEWFGAPADPAATGRFVADDGRTVAVRRVAELPTRAADGARVFNFAPLDARPGWDAGEAGDLIVEGIAVAAVEVPAGALVLDAGQWYVLTESAGKLKPRRVEPGQPHGDDVVILQGLSPGTRVVTRQAYLLYHRDFAARYTPPD